MENPIEMEDLGVPLFSETPIYGHLWEVISRKKHVFAPAVKWPGFLSPNWSFKRGPKETWRPIVVYSLKRGKETSVAIMAISCSLRLFSLLKWFFHHGSEKLLNVQGQLSKQKNKNRRKNMPFLVTWKGNCSLNFFWGVNIFFLQGSLIHGFRYTWSKYPIILKTCYSAKAPIRWDTVR